jgi:hypothetical protein
VDWAEEASNAEVSELEKITLETRLSTISLLQLSITQHRVSVFEAELLVRVAYVHLTTGEQDCVAS